MGKMKLWEIIVGVIEAIIVGAVILGFFAGLFVWANWYWLKPADTTGSKPTTELSSEPTGEFELLDWSQEYYENIGMYDFKLKVCCKVTNTGSIDIEFYNLFFKIIYADGTEHEDSVYGSDLPRGESTTDSAEVDVSGQVVSVSLTRYELR